MSKRNLKPQGLVDLFDSNLKVFEIFKCAHPDVQVYRVQRNGEDFVFKYGWQAEFEANALDRIGVMQGVPKLFEVYERKCAHSALLREYIPGILLQDYFLQSLALGDIHADIHQILLNSHRRDCALRDVKAKNFIIREDKKPFFVDFGVAHLKKPKNIPYFDKLCDEDFRLLRFMFEDLECTFMY